MQHARHDIWKCNWLLWGTVVCQPVNVEKRYSVNNSPLPSLLLSTNYHSVEAEESTRMVLVHRCWILSIAQENTWHLQELN